MSNKLKQHKNMKRTEHCQKLWSPINAPLNTKRIKFQGENSVSEDDQLVDKFDSEICDFYPC